MPVPRAHVENTCARGAGIHGVFSVSHTTHTTPQPTTTTRPPHHTETDTERERDIERRGDGREEDKRVEERREKREDPFSVWWCMDVFCWCSDFPVNSVCARDFSLLNSVKYNSFLDFSAPWPVNSFFNICEFILLCSYSFHFFLNFFLLMQLQFQIFPNYLFMQLQFFFAGINSA